MTVDPKEGATHPSLYSLCTNPGISGLRALGFALPSKIFVGCVCIHPDLEYVAELNLLIITI